MYFSNVMFNQAQQMERFLLCLALSHVSDCWSPLKTGDWATIWLHCFLALSTHGYWSPAHLDLSISFVVVFVGVLVLQKKVYVILSYFFNYFILDNSFSVTMQFRTDYCSCTRSHASLFSSSHGFQLLAGFFQSSLEGWFPLCCFQPCFSVFIFIEWSQLVI